MTLADSMTTSIKNENTVVTNLEFLEGTLWEILNIYTSNIDKYSYENAFNQLFIWPFVNVFAKSNTTGKCQSSFESGQPHLQSMSRQLKAVGFLMTKKIVISPTASGNTGKVKLNFDYHKGMFGLLGVSFNTTLSYS
ncbi:hypothetical protein EDC94DRAFT_580451 [Helicostylum pulchrum]|nr:hypothetical protein EDC94DRAFT_580451 [Helicostylum pulchrum]